MNFDSIPTPAVLVDDTIARKNIAAYQAYCDKYGLRLRPHIKTHKLPLYAQAQIDAGAVGITCQKISEAEVMADAGMQDILITYNILGHEKLDRLVALSNRVDALSVVADNTVVIDGLSRRFSKVSKPLVVLVECDTGAGRCGAQSPQEAVELAQHIVAAEGLSFGGLMTYPPVGGAKQVQSFMVETIKLLKAQNIDCPIISSGGSPDMWHAHEAPVVTEYRIGTYIYNDRSLVTRETCSWEDCALTVLATIVSKPTPERAIIDAGSKTLTSDLIGLEHYGCVKDNTNIIVSALSEEHGILETLNGETIHLNTGDRIQIIPNHCCVVSNMVDSITLLQSDKSTQVIPVGARGCIT